MIFSNSNSFNDQDAVMVGQALIKNSNIWDFSLENNSLTEVGNDAMLKSVFDTSSMNSLVDSIHTCSIDIHNLGWVNGIRDPIVNKKTKIISTLLDATIDSSDFNLLEGVHVECMPYVLALIQVDPRRRLRNREIYEYSLTSCALTFEILRSWELPLLFSFC